MEVEVEIAQVLVLGRVLVAALMVIIESGERLLLIATDWVTAAHGTWTMVI